MFWQGAAFRGGVLRVASNMGLKPRAKAKGRRRG